MTISLSGAIALDLALASFALKKPFRITGHHIVTSDVVTVRLEQHGHVGWGEASGVFYREGEDTSGIVRQIEAVRARIEVGRDREELQRLLRPAERVTRSTARCGIWRRSGPVGPPGR